MNYYFLNFGEPQREALFVRGEFSRLTPYANEVPDVFVLDDVECRFDRKYTLYDTLFVWHEPEYRAHFGCSGKLTGSSVCRIGIGLKSYYTAWMFDADGDPQPLYYFRGLLTAQQLYEVSEFAMTLPLEYIDDMLPLDGGYEGKSVECPEYAPSYSMPRCVDKPSAED